MTMQSQSQETKMDSQPKVSLQKPQANLENGNTPSETTDTPQQTQEEEIITPAILNLDYRYVRLLGEGANGRTWLAKDRKNATDVAIKELKFTNDIKCFDLFEREAEVLQSVNIAGVPRFIGNYTEGGLNYIIQEYIPYPSLEMLIDRGETFTEEEVYTIMELVSRILYSLQTQYIPPIIHRDIKPGNILYRRREGTKEAKIWLIDFGAVANPQKQSSGSTIAGTFGYMAPEQLQGEVSTRSDFYALGATALHLLTGVFPYEIPSELFNLQFHPVIEEKAPKTTRPMIELLDYLLASNAEKRPSTVADLRKAILDAIDASRKYRMIEVNDDDEYDEEVTTFEPTSKFGKWLSNKWLGKWIHARRIAFFLLKRRVRRCIHRTIRTWIIKPIRLRMLKRRERIAKNLQAKEETRLTRQREANGIYCECTAKRVAVDYTFSKVFRKEITLLEGIFSYQGNWYAAFVHNNHGGIEFECLPDDYDDKKIKANTFKVIFVPDTIDIVIPKQKIQLTRDFFTQLLGREA